MVDVVNVQDKGIVPSGSDISAPFNDLMAELDGSPVKLNWGAGYFNIGRGLKAEYDDFMLWEGEGPWLTRFTHYAEQDGDVALDWNTGEGNYHSYGGVSDLGISPSSRGAAFDKVALRVTDSEGFYCDNVHLTGWHGANADNVGLQWRGRQTSTFERLKINADVQVRISANPNTRDGYLSADHLVFRDCNLIGDPQARANKTLPNTNVLIDPDAHVSGLTFTGYQGWIYGHYGLYWDHSSGPMPHAQSINLNLETVRTEQSRNPDGWGVYIKGRPERTLRCLTIGNGCTFDETQNGIYLRNVSSASIEGAQLAQGADKTSLDIDHCDSVSVRDIWTRRMTWQYTRDQKVGAIKVGSMDEIFAVPSLGAPISAHWVGQSWLT